MKVSETFSAQDYLRAALEKMRGSLNFGGEYAPLVVDLSKVFNFLSHALVHVLSFI